MNAPPQVSLRGPRGLAAAVPSLLGFVPSTPSAVLVCTRDRRMGLTVRADLEPSGPWDARFAPLADSLAPMLRREAPTQVHLIGWGVATGDADELHHELRRRGLPMGECVTVQDRDGVLMALDEADPRWEPLGEDPIRPVAALASGAVVAGSREELVARIAPTGELPGPFDQYTLDALVDVGHRDARLRTLAALALDGDALRRVREVYARAARVGRGDGRDAALTMVAVSSWLTGDGAMANVALSACTPHYPLARLLRHALSIPLSPSDLRGLLLSIPED